MPSCVTRMMGPALPDPDKSGVHDRLLSLFKKADYEVIYPQVWHLAGSSGCAIQLFCKLRGLQQ